MSKFRSLIRSALLLEAGQSAPSESGDERASAGNPGSRTLEFSDAIDSAALQGDATAPDWQPIGRGDEDPGPRLADWEPIHREKSVTRSEWANGITESGTAPNDWLETATCDGDQPAGDEELGSAGGCGTGHRSCPEDDDLIFVDFEDEDPSPPAAPQAEYRPETVANWRPICWPPEPIDGRRPLVLPSPELIAPLAEDMAVGFQGAWDARGEMVQCYRATPMEAAKPDRPARPLAVQSHWETDRIAAIDLALINAALENLIQSIELRRQVYVVAPIHWTTLLPPFVDALVACLRYFSEGARSRWLCLEIVGTPPTENPRQLVRLCETVRGLARELLIAITPSGPRVAEVRAMAPSAVGARYRDLDPVVIPVMAQKAGVGRSYVWGVDTGAALYAALDQGYGLIGGDAVRALRAEPERAEFVPRATLLGCV